MNKTRKVLLLEFNEINWHVIDKLLAGKGKAFLPNLGRLRAEGTTGVQTAVERPPLLDPWITWVTLHTGVSPNVHGASVLEQKGETIRAKRTWQYASEAGRSVGVFGSISSYPPAPVDGFMVPGPFAPGNETYPERLQPVQAINRRYTQVHNKTVRPPGLLENMRAGMDLFRLGLRPSTCAHVAAQLVSERVSPSLRWRRASLQPRLNFDFFSALYRRGRPDFATWHSNHAAHYMHHYWRAWDDTGFPVKSTPEERKQYGEAVPYGYKLCDELLGRAMRLIDDETVLVVASSMGQQPYVSEKYREGKTVVRIKNIEALLDVIGRAGIAEVVPTMVPQWNLVVPDSNRRAALMRRFESARREVAGRREAAFAISETGDCLTLTPLGLAAAQPGIRYFFPEDGQDSAKAYALEDLFATDTPTVKQGMHHIDGVLGFYGAGIKRGGQLQACTNLDVAPTLLSLLGVAVPPVMEGRVLKEAFQQ